MQTTEIATPSYVRKLPREHNNIVKSFYNLKTSIFKSVLLD